MKTHTIARISSVNPLLSSLSRQCLQPGVALLPPGLGGCSVSPLSNSVLPAPTPPYPCCSERSGSSVWFTGLRLASGDRGHYSQSSVSLPSLCLCTGLGVGWNPGRLQPSPVPAVVSHPSPPHLLWSSAHGGSQDITPDYAATSGPDRLLKKFFPAAVIEYVLCPGCIIGQPTGVYHPGVLLPNDILGVSHEFII